MNESQMLSSSMIYGNEQERMSFVIFLIRVDENSQYKHNTSQKRSRGFKCNYPLVYCVKKKKN